MSTECTLCWPFDCSGRHNPENSTAATGRGTTKGSMTKTTDELRRAAQQLRESERGRRVLEKLIELREAGATGLDNFNQQAAGDLFLSMLFNPWDWPAELHTKEEAAK